MIKNVLEKEIEAYLRDQVKKLGGLCLKFVSPGFTGVPDRLIMIKPKIFFYVELKKKNKQLSPRQLFVKKQFKKLGFEVYRVDSKKEVKKIINEIRRKALPSIHNK